MKRAHALTFAEQAAARISPLRIATAFVEQIAVRRCCCTQAMECSPLLAMPIRHLLDEGSGRAKWILFLLSNSASYIVAAVQSIYGGLST